MPLLAKHVRFADEGLLEQDVRLHLLLADVTSDPRIGPRAVFKGGTCLIKCYLGYPRFSIDLDFTWKPESGWLSMGTQELRRELRPVQRALVDALGQAARSQAVRFEATQDVVFGQSNRMMTALLHYETARRIPSVIKFQVSFAERLLFPVRRRMARSLLHRGASAEMTALDSDIPRRYAKPVSVQAYDAREILAEKGRAILTRKAAKARDLLDLFLMEEELGLRIEDHLDSIELKTRCAVDRVPRYAKHLEEARGRFDRLMQQDVRPFLLRDVEMAAFEEYRVRALKHLEDVTVRLRSREMA